MGGTEADLARVHGRPPPRARPTRTAVARLLSAGAELVDVRPASEALGLERGTFLHAGPPHRWDRASGPMRGALVGAMLFEGLADTPEEAERALARRRRSRWTRATTTAPSARWPAWSARRCGCSSCATRCTAARPGAR